MVGKMISTLRSFACAQDDVKFARHPKLGATHVANCVNVGGICNAYLKSFSGAINIDKRLRNKCAIVCVGKNIFFLGRESKRSSETSYACEREGNNFFNKVYSLLTSH